MFNSLSSAGLMRGLPYLLVISLAIFATGAKAQVQSTQIAVPSYFWPGDESAAGYTYTEYPLSWYTMSANGPHGSSPGPVTIAIANVNNGPDYTAYPVAGNAYSPDWHSAITGAHSAGIKVLGYVDTGYFGTTGHLTRTRASDVESWRSQIEHDIDAWYSFYPGNIDGIFLDEATTACGPSGKASDTLWSDLYRDIRDYVKSNHPGAVVAANPGTETSYCYEEAADILVNYEGDAACYMSGVPGTPPAGLPVSCSYYYISPQNNGWPAYSDQNKFWNLLYDVNGSYITSTLDAIKQNTVGYAYIIPYTLAENPYSQLAWDPFWSDELQAALPVNASATAPSTPTILGTPVIGYTTATIEWSLSSGPNGVVGYDIYQSGVSENGGRMWSVPQPAPGSGQNTQWYDLDGLLQPNSTYTFTVVARDAAGLQSGPSNSVTFTTLASTQSPPGAPGNLQASATTYTTATLNWQASTGPNTVVAYDIFENGSKILTLTESIDNGPATSTTIIGLNPGQSYTFNVVARDWKGSTSSASSVTVTPPALPGGTAISSATATYSSSGQTLTYSANFLVPFSNHRVFIYSGNSSNPCYIAGVGAQQMCADYLIQDGNQLWVFAGASDTDYKWVPVTTTTYPNGVQPTVTVNGSGYTWTIPLNALNGGTSSGQALFQADGSFAPTYTGAISLGSD